MTFSRDGVTGVTPSLFQVLLKGYRSYQILPHTPLGFPYVCAALSLTYFRVVLLILPTTMQSATVISISGSVFPTIISTRINNL
jgi:hypothetical protein